MESTEAPIVTMCFRIPESDQERIKDLAERLYEGNAAMVIRRAIRELLERAEAEARVA